MTFNSPTKKCPVKDQCIRKYLFYAQIKDVIDGLSITLKPNISPISCANPLFYPKRTMRDKQFADRIACII